MNILIRVSGAPADKLHGWYPVPNVEDIWVYELESQSSISLGDELARLSNKLSDLHLFGAKLILHVGKYDESAPFELDSDTLNLINTWEMALEVY
jgi:hypothetical protein